MDKQLDFANLPSQVLWMLFGPVLLEDGRRRGFLLRMQGRIVIVVCIVVAIIAMILLTSFITRSFFAWDFADKLERFHGTGCIVKFVLRGSRAVKQKYAGDACAVQGPT